MTPEPPETEFRIVDFDEDAINRAIDEMYPDMLLAEYDVVDVGSDKRMFLCFIETIDMEDMIGQMGGGMGMGMGPGGPGGPGL